MSTFDEAIKKHMELENLKVEQEKLKEEINLLLKQHIADGGVRSGKVPQGLHPEGKSYYSIKNKGKGLFICFSDKEWGSWLKKENRKQNTSDNEE